MGVKGIQFTGGGEPTIHKDFVFFMRTAQEMGFDTALVTNGSMLVKEEIREVALNTVWTRISIDAAHSRHYMEERGVKRQAWENMLEGARNLCQEAQNVENPPLIGAGFVVHPRNYTQIHDAVRLYYDVGFHNVRLGLMFNSEEEAPYKNIWPVIRSLCEDAVSEYDGKGDRNFRVLDRTQQRYNEFAQQEEGAIDYEFCGFQNFTCYIGGDLNVYRCCMWAYHPHGLVGSIKDQTFKELWDSKEKKDNYANFNAKSCGKCQFNKINKVIEGILNPAPEQHASFI
jgi:radical SAM protein with 4Fe4S-binding SPASM domain